MAVISLCFGAGEKCSSSIPEPQPGSQACPEEPEAAACSLTEGGLLPLLTLTVLGQQVSTRPWCSPSQPIQDCLLD